MRPASAASTPRPDALSFAPGAPGAESVWAITIRRQVRGVSTIPITLRDRPRPGTANPWTATRSPAPLKIRRMRRWARASAALAAGRGPAAEMPVATE